MRRHIRHRILRNVRVLRDEPRHAAKAEARAEPVDQMRQLLGVVVAGQTGLRRIGAFGDERGEPHHVVAEARIAGVAENGEPLLEQFSHAGGIAQRRAGADLEAVHRAVGAEQRHLKQPPALAAPLQHAGKLAAELLDGAEHVGLAGDRIGEALLGHRGRHRQARRDRLFDTAQRLVEAEQQLLAEARRERRARAPGQIGDARETGGFQAGDDIGIDPQRRDRQRQRRRFGFAAAATIPCLPKRATPQAQPTVSATATRARKP